MIIGRIGDLLKPPRGIRPKDTTDMPAAHTIAIQRIALCPAAGKETRIECAVANPLPVQSPPVRVRIRIFTADDSLFQSIPITIPPIPPRSSHTVSRFVRMRRPEPFRFTADAQTVE